MEKEIQNAIFILFYLQLFWYKPVSQSIDLISMNRLCLFIVYCLAFFVALPSLSPSDNYLFHSSFFCLSLSALSFHLSVSLCFTFSVSLCLYLTVSVCLYRSLFLTVSSLSLSLCISFSLSLYICVYLSISHWFLFLSLSFCLSVLL